MSSFTIQERTADLLTAIVCTFDSDGASYTSGDVVVNQACGVIQQIMYIPTSGDEPTTLWDLLLQDENGSDVLRGLGANLDNTIVDRFIDEASTHLKYSMCVTSLKFVGTNMGAGGGSGKIILLLK